MFAIMTVIGEFHTKRFQFCAILRMNVFGKVSFETSYIHLAVAAEGMNRRACYPIRPSTPNITSLRSLLNNTKTFTMKITATMF